MADLTTATVIADKDLPIIKPADYKVDTTAVFSLNAKALEAVKLKWVSSARTNDQLLLLLDQIPAKIARVSDPAKIARLKEEYAVVLKEIEVRRAAAVKVG